MRAHELATLALVIASVAITPISAAPAAETPKGFGPIRFGMTVEQLRAATPGAEWTALTDMQFQTKSVKIAGETFAMTYTDLTWDNYRLDARAEIEVESAAACSAHHAKLIEFLETEYGQLTPLEPKAKPGYRILPSRSLPDWTTTEVAVGKSSQAKLWRQERGGGAWGSSLEAQFETPALRVELHAFASENLPPPKTPHACEVEVNVETTIPRPPHGLVAREDLVFESTISIGAAHHSLDGAPAVPPQGIDVDLDCIVSESNRRLQQCNAPSKDAAIAPFVGAAQFRASLLRIARRAKSGKWTPGEITSIRLHLAPDDRRALPALDFTKASWLRVETKPSRPRFPQRPLDHDASANLVLACTVQSDGSVLCPEIKCDNEDYKDDFAVAALQYELGKRYAPRLTNGEPSAGVSFRDVVKFQIIP